MTRNGNNCNSNTQSECGEIDVLSQLLQLPLQLHNINCGNVHINYNYNNIYNSCVDNVNDNNNIDNKEKANINNIN